MACRGPWGWPAVPRLLCPWSPDPCGLHATRRTQRPLGSPALLIEVKQEEESGESDGVVARMGGQEGAGQWGRRRGPVWALWVRDRERDGGWREREGPTRGRREVFCL